MFQVPKIVHNKLFKVGVIISAFLIVVACIVLGFWFTTRALFSKNPHFVLKYVAVESTGWWQSKSADIIEILKLKINESNIFEANLLELRKKLEKEPSIEKVSISRILPDTLRFSISERIPRAYLDSRKSLLVVDSSGMVMLRNSCLNINPKLPVIADYETKVEIKPGMMMPQLKPAMELIMLTHTDYPEFRIFVVSMKNTDELEFILFYEDDKLKPYRVYMHTTDIPSKLNVLKSALIRALRSNDPRRTINLTFDGSVVFN